MVDKQMFVWQDIKQGLIGRGRYAHLVMFWYWPVYFFMFFFVERLYRVPEYHIVSCHMDELIPFSEFFVIPYLFWFVFMVWMMLYSFFHDSQAFIRYNHYFILTFSATIIFYMIYPTAQELRPVSFARDNVFTRFLSGLYGFDTNTNVCPSLHVIGAAAAMFAGFDMDRYRSALWRIFFVAAFVLISMSTVFLKQHSVIDVLTALPVCAIGYVLVYRLDVLRWLRPRGQGDPYKEE